MAGLDAEGRVVVYGGSFNAPHIAHQMACLYLLEARGAAEVWLLPTWHHPFGKELAPFEHRAAMCRELAAPLGSRVVVSEIERERDGPSRTFDTLHHLIESHSDKAFALAIGADILAETAQWHRWSDIEAMVPIVVIGRSGYDADGSGVELPKISSTEIRRRLAAGETTQDLVPVSVARYIRSNALYGAAP